MPALSNGFTVSLPSKVPVLPSAVVTVTLPLLSTSTLSPSARLFFALTAAATLSLSSWVKLVTSFTSVLSGAWRLRILSFCTTVLSAGISPVLPFWLIVTLPSSPTVISSSFKFLSLLASLTASLTACFSGSVNFVLSSTLTGSFGGLSAIVTFSCVTVLSGAIVPVLPSLVTVTVPSSATTTSAGVKFKSGLALITAASTFSCSGSVNDVLSFTTVFSGSFNFKGVLSVCSQTAYTVFGAVMLSKSVTFASFASFLSAQPLKVYPSLVGSAGFVTFLFTALIFVVSLPSVNLPWFASKVTVTSSE